MLKGITNYLLRKQGIDPGHLDKVAEALPNLLQAEKYFIITVSPQDRKYQEQIINTYGHNIYSEELLPLVELVAGRLERQESILKEAQELLNESDERGRH